MKTAVLTLGILLVGCGAPPHYKLMHKPDRGCPPGYAERSHAFLERDGAGPGIETVGDLDELRAGESIMVTIPLGSAGATQ